MLDIFLEEASGLLHITRARWHAQRIESAIQSGAHERAAEHILSCVRAATELNLSPRAWRELLTLGIAQVLRAGTRGLLTELVEQYAWLAWSGERESAQPWALIHTLHALPGGHEAMAAALGDLLTRQYSGCALGPYVAAHFRELSSGAPEKHGLARANATRFAHAAQLAHAAQRPELAAHCQLRQGVCLLLSGEDRAQGRALLRALDVEALHVKETVWYALGMTMSEFWLDRVRAADALDALATQVMEARPGEAARVLTREVIEDLIDFLLARQGFELQPAEEDRLRALITLVHKGSHTGRQKQAALNLLLELQQATHAPLSESEALITQLEERAPGLGKEWMQSARVARALHLLVTQEVAPALPRQPPGTHHTLSLRAMEILAAIKSEDAGRLEQALLQTRKDLSAPAQRAWLPEEFGALAVAWPALIDWLKAHKPRKLRGAQRAEELSQEEQSLRERHAFILEVGMGCVSAWARAARAPSYGWWPLAAHLIGANMLASAHVVGERALASREVPGEAVRELVCGKVLHWAVSQNNRAAMTRWLEAMEAMATA